jgi:23S rRNA pseudouridine2605 synthase
MPSGRILLFHKPKGCVVTRCDERGRKTVNDLLPAWVRDEGWVPVGRLDLESRGALLLVREGTLVEALGRLAFLEKVYEVWVRGRVTGAHIAAALRGSPTSYPDLIGGEVTENERRRGRPASSSMNG